MRGKCTPCAANVQTLVDVDTCLRETMRVLRNDTHPSSIGVGTIRVCCTCVYVCDDCTVQDRRTRIRSKAFGEYQSAAGTEQSPVLSGKSGSGLDVDVATGPALNTSTSAHSILDGECAHARSRCTLLAIRHFTTRLHAKC
jgi:hypothetical protein